ncbi:MAG TPA: glycosyltransferase [Methanothrix soehngenii]|uniref:glycosyltransferase n=1 Tax=Methanothrix soehngenii TaxID=2223 RepID=UPI002BBEB1B1|nr:glycosyltransferase [Methanothrix soehngenii]HOI20122.1 glycosyltransferase [Methanothrix soehngenii]
MKENAFASMIIYIKNNANEIPEVLPSLDNLMADHFENYEIIVVNDASRDESYYQIRKAAKGLKRDITLINLAWVHGPEKGIMAGVDHSIGDYVFEIEMSKINYPLGTLYELFTEAGKGFDIVSATPANKQSIGDLLFFKLFNKISYLPFDVYKETARIVSRRAINSILGMNEQIVYRKILYKFSGFPSKVLEYEPVAALSKSRGLSLKEKMRLAMDIFVSFSNIGTDLSVALSSFFLAISLLLGIYALSVYITQKGVVPGWTTQMLFMSICFSGVFMVLGLQSKYISAILLEARRRPNYTVHSVERYHGTQEEN